MLKKSLITLLILPLLIYLARVGVADFLRLGSCDYVDAVIYGVEPLDPVALDKARQRLLVARVWDECNPVIPEYLGQIEFMRAQIFSFNPVMHAGYLHEAIVDFDSAIALRPNSSYLWAARMTAGSRLLVANSRAGVAMDRVELEAVKNAFRRAAVLGPFEPRVLVQLMRVGHLRYKAFSPEERSVMDGVVKRVKQLNIKM